MKNFLKAVALICFGAFLLVGITVGVEHVKDNKKEVETVTFTFMTSSEDGCAYPEEVTLEFEEGMTWNDWIDSDYNTIGLKDDLHSPCDCGSCEMSFLIFIGEESIPVSLEDVIVVNGEYYVG